MADRNNPQMLKRFEKAFGRLPRTTREIFILHRLNDLSYQEIAQRTGLSVGEVERHIARAIYRLAKEIDEPTRWWGRFRGR